jgi:uncharacterized ParB-like nuclease family protein
MNTTEIIKGLDKILSDAQIIRDISHILWGETASTEVELNGSKIVVPLNEPIDIVTKAFFKEYFDIGYGNCYRVQIAIGGVVDQSYGLLCAKYCFATLYYNEKQLVITVDFHSEMR